MLMNDKEKWAEAKRKALADIASTSDEEDARITAAALADQDAQPWTDAMWAKAVTFDERQKQRASSRTCSVEVAPQVVVPIDTDVIEHFRKSGQGWQGRINEALRKAAGLG